MPEFILLGKQSLKLGLKSDHQSEDMLSCSDISLLNFFCNGYAMIEEFSDFYVLVLYVDITPGNRFWQKRHKGQYMYLK